MTAYGEWRGRVLHCAGGSTYPIVGRRHLSSSSRFDGQDVVVTLMDVDLVPNVHHHLLSFTRIQNNGHPYTASREGFRIDLFAGNTLKIPGPSRLLKMYTRYLDIGGGK